MQDKFIIDQIRENFANMTDEQILCFAKENGLTLSSDGFLILREELGKRNIGSDILKNLEHEIILQHGLKVKRFEADVRQDLFIKAWEYAFALREKGESDYTIFNGLLKLDIKENYAHYMVRNIKTRAEMLRTDAVVHIHMFQCTQPRINWWHFKKSGLNG